MGGTRPKGAVVTLPIPFRAPRDTVWRARAACRGRGPAQFVTDQTANSNALAICRGCAVRRPCALYAVALTDAGVHMVGTWGGVHLPASRARGRAMAQLRALAGPEAPRP